MTSRLPDYVHRELESNYRAGRSFAVAAVSAGVTRMTAYRHYKQFAARSVPRATPLMSKRVPTKTRKRERQRNWFNPEPYTGPVWIGEPITPQPKTTGPQWIGKAIT